MSSLHACGRLLGGSSASPHLRVTAAVELELTMAVIHLPLLTCNMRAEASGLATVIDALDIGIGACASASLSDRGRDTPSVLQGSPFLLGGDTVAFIKLFAGAGRFRRGCELAGLNIAVHAVVERAASAQAVLRYRWPEALVWVRLLRQKQRFHLSCA